MFDKLGFNDPQMHLAGGSEISFAESSHREVFGRERALAARM